MSPLQRILVAVVIFAIFATAASGYFFFQFKNSQKEIQTLKTDPSSSTGSDENKRLVEEVGKLMALPTNEEPTIATVTDIDKLKEQAFFSNAKNGYKVLIYTSNKKAILYDPVAKKIIDVAPVNIGNDASSSASQSAVQSNGLSIKVALRNGTKTVGLTTKIEDEIKKTNSNIEVTSKENAEKRDYDRTVVVILNDSARDTATKIAKDLKAGIEGLPAGELTPESTDVLVIVGKDKS